MNAIPVIETARLRLRPLTLADADAYHAAILSDPDVMRYLPGGQPLPRDRAGFTIQCQIDNWARDGIGLWAVERAEDGRLIGHCGLMHLPDSTEIEVAYALAQSVWGQGFAPEAAHAALRFGFEERGLARIVAVAVPANVASQRVMEKIGMTNEGLQPAYGTELAFYSMVRAAFRPGDAPYRVAGV
jgi:ribosomal-protein-alanine N-acetyltransferase